MWYRRFAGRARGSDFWSGLMVILLLSFAVQPGFGDPQGQGVHIYRAGFSPPVSRSQATGPLVSVMSHAAYYNGYSGGLTGSVSRPVVTAPRSIAPVPSRPFSESVTGAPQTEEQNTISPPKNPIVPPIGPITPPTSLGFSSQTVQGINQTAKVSQPALKSQLRQDPSAIRANIEHKFQVAEDKAAHQPGVGPDRRNRLQQTFVFFTGLIDLGYPLPLLDTWCDDLLDDQVDPGMPMGLIDQYWGQPLSNADYVEYYEPYEVCTYETPQGQYIQVTYQNGVVTQGDAMSSEDGGGD